MLLGLLLKIKVFDLRSISRWPIAVLLSFGLFSGTASADSMSCDLALINRELKWIDLPDGRRAHYDAPAGMEFGDPRIVIYLGGFGGISFENSRELVRHSQALSYKMVRVPLRKAGYNLRHLIDHQKTDELSESVSIDEQLDHLATVIRALTDKPVVVVGLSAGFAYAGMLAYKYPNLTHAVGKVAGFIRDPATYRLAHIPAAKSAADQISAVTDFWNQFLPGPYQIPNPIKDTRQAALRTAFGDLIPAELGEYEDQYFDAIYDQDEILKPVNMHRVLGSIKCKTYFLAAKDDGLIPNWEHRDAFDRIPEEFQGGGEVSYIPDSRHNLVADVPDQVANWIEGILWDSEYLK